MTASTNFFIPKWHEISTVCPETYFGLLAMIPFSKKMMSDHIRYKGKKDILGTDLSHLCFPHATQGCRFWRGLAGELFRDRSASASQLLPALLSVCPVLWQFLFLWKVCSPKNVFLTVPCIHYFLQPLLYLPLSHAKLSPKVVFSLSFDYLLQKHRTPRHS